MDHVANIVYTTFLCHQSEETQTVLFTTLVQALCVIFCTIQTLLQDLLRSVLPVLPSSASVCPWLGKCAGCHSASVSLNIHLLLEEEKLR